MAANWLEKIQQDADLQMLLGLAGGALVLFVVLLIIIVVRLKNRKKKQTENPLGEIRVQSTHTPNVEEKAKDHVVFRNKVANKGVAINADPKPEATPEPSIPTPTTPEIPPVVPEPPVQVQEAPRKADPKPEPLNVTLPSVPSVNPSSTLETFNAEEKKKEILKAIEQTRSREENLRILNERLRELRGESNVESSTDSEVKSQELEKEPLEEVNIPTNEVETQAEVEPKSTETVAEISEPMEADTVHEETTQETPEVASFVQETLLHVPEPEDTTYTPPVKPESDSPKTFTEWLSALSAKKR
ncbi:MAG: hypothetical protein N2167_01710 [Flavobacteriales bacterium]|nr:hypothetical protein [Flavobacteriales bacterium]